MPAPVVTVLLPARNAASTVARAVESLLGGTLRDIRILAVDDGSTDSTRQILQGLAALEADSHPRKVGARIQGIPVVSGDELGPPGKGLLLVCVGVRWAREALRAGLAARGWVEGVDFLCAA